MDYDALRDMAESMLQQFGSITSLRVTTGRVVNPATGVVTNAGTTMMHDVTLVSLPVTSVSALGEDPSNRRKLVMTARRVVPKEGDEMWIEGAWRFLGPVTPVAPHMGEAVVYNATLTL